MRGKTILGSFAVLFALVSFVPAGVRATTFTASPRVAPSACSELVVNGGFESGATGWQLKTNGAGTLIGTTLPHTGQLGAILGARNDAQDEMEQEMSLSAGQGVTLRLWWYMQTTETTHPRDTLDVSVKLSGGQEVGVLHITDGDTPGAWQQAVIDLSSYAGQSVRIKFRAITDANRPTDFYVDDVSVQTCTGGTETSTPSVTHTPSASVSPSVTHTPSASVSPTSTSTPKARIYLPLISR
jgi:hypothetical protein